jgi:hypothetical protein
MLGTSLLLDYRRGHNPVRLDNAIEALAEASSSPLASKTMRPALYATFSAALEARHKVTKDLEDLKRPG